MLEQWQSWSSSFVMPELPSFGLGKSTLEEPAAQGPPASPIRFGTADSRSLATQNPSGARAQEGDGVVSAEDEGSHMGAFSSLLSEHATLAAPARSVDESGTLAEPARRHSYRPVYSPDMRMDEEDVEEHMSTPFPATTGTESEASGQQPAVDTEQLQVVIADEPPHWLQMSSESLVSQWAPFSSYIGTDTTLAVRPPPIPEESLAALPDASPEGFRVLSVKYQESLSRNTVSVGKYFFVDAAAFPSYEFSSHPCLVEQWRGSLLVWSGAVILSLGALGAVDLPEAKLPAFGRKEPRRASQAGDFEVDDVIFVVGFHRDLAVSVGKHMALPENLFGYQCYCMGKRPTPRQDIDTMRSSTKYVDELGDLGKHLQITVEVDEKELIAIRGTTESRASMAVILEPTALVEDTNTVAELARENSLVLAGVEVAEEGTIPHNVRSSTSSEAWNARRQALLSARPRHVPDREATL
ncbi:unnamed protein product [Symbiodinium natans]|uniref:Uncharacterized protein n=1 Tax=Symbiodinium natans TaxID=878477 RepID=A0A812KY26_9DINO|nr:unnamed protein product [Symbiodinium natans]